jgi:hypothetical protein
MSDLLGEQCGLLKLAATAQNNIRANDGTCKKAKGCKSHHYHLERVALLGRNGKARGCPSRESNEHSFTNTDMRTRATLHVLTPTCPNSHSQLVHSDHVATAAASGFALVVERLATQQGRWD